MITPHLDDAGENAKRRALLFIRHFSLWKALPDGTEWFEVEIKAADLAQFESFRGPSGGSSRGETSGIPAVAERLRTLRNHDVAEKAFLSKIDSLGDKLRHDIDPGAVLLIGLNESGPLTILDGNHRLVAALLTSPETLVKISVPLRTIAQDDAVLLVPHGCCDPFPVWVTLLTHLVRDPKAELARLLEAPAHRKAHVSL